MTRGLVSLNAGSSSIKFGLYRLDPDDTLHHAAGGKIEGIGTAPHLVGHADDGTLAIDRNWPDGAALSHEDLLGELISWAVDHLKGNEVVAIGHRVVHGGTRFSGPVVIDEAVLTELEALSPLAPLHQPHNCAAIRAMLRLAPGVPQIACFDTAFHFGRPDVTTRFALPRSFHDRGIRRYGFHGLSYEFIAAELVRVAPDIAGGRVVMAHLGNGASLCAMVDGRSVDTTMGFTALDGLVMGTRSGTLDAGLVVHLIAREGMTAEAVETMLYEQSGLLGVSGLSSDMRALHGSDAVAAREAVDLFVARAAREVAALATTIAGIDALVFTAGIGENDAVVRAAIVARLAFLGAELDPVANAAHDRVISTPDSRIRVLVIPTDEEAMIARHTLTLVEAPA